MKRLLVLPVLLLTLLVGNPAFSADFQKVQDAYDRGDYAAALREWRPLAELGHPHAQYNLGLTYRLREGVPQNDKTAVKWFRLAAKPGDTVAQTLLGLMYEAGKGVPQSDETAMKWYTLAAKQRNADAQEQVEGL